MEKTIVRALASVALVLGLVPAAPGADFEDYYVPMMGESRLVFDSNPAYINDHSLIRAEDGSWHLIGITHDKVLSGRLPVPWLEEEFAHAVAEDISGPWRALPRCLQVDRGLGETHVWAPHVVYDQGRYYCFYAGGGGHWESMINLATSTDLLNWVRAPENPLFVDFYDARDPMVLRDGDRFIMYYTKTYSRTERYSTVAYRLSDDLVHWSEPGLAYVVRTLPATLPNSQYTESPFVVPYRGLYYLFMCTPDLGYRNTRVFVSADPLNFKEENEITTLIAHCAEVVQDGDQYYLSHAGWFYDGLYLAPLAWKPARTRDPIMLFANSGDDDRFLAGAPGASVIPRAFMKALRAGPGQAITYEFPAPPGIESVTLAFEERGECRVIVGDKTVLDEGEAGRGEWELHVFDLRQPGLDPGRGLRVRFEPSGQGSSDRPEVSFVKVYFR